MSIIIDDLEIQVSPEKRSTIEIYDKVYKEGDSYRVETNIIIEEREDNESEGLAIINRALKNKVNSLSPYDQGIAKYLIEKRDSQNNC